MKHILTATLALCAGCATIFNSRTATVIPPPGGAVDGVGGPLVASQKRPHDVVYPDGRHCVVESNVSVGYLILDIILLPAVLPIVIDAVTENWMTLDGDGCPGVMVD